MARNWVQLWDFGHELFLIDLRKIYLLLVLAFNRLISPVCVYFAQRRKFQVLCLTWPNRLLILQQVQPIPDILDFLVIHQRFRRRPHCATLGHWFLSFSIQCLLLNAMNVIPVVPCLRNDIAIRLVWSPLASLPLTRLFILVPVLALLSALLIIKKLRKVGYFEILIKVRVVILGF